MGNPTNQEQHACLTEIPSNVRHRILNDLYALKLGIQLLHHAYSNGDVSTARQTSSDVDRMISLLMTDLSEGAS